MAVEKHPYSVKSDNARRMNVICIFKDGKTEKLKNGYQQLTLNFTITLFIHITLTEYTI